MPRQSSKKKSKNKNKNKKQNNNNTMLQRKRYTNINGRQVFQNRSTSKNDDTTSAFSNNFCYLIAITLIAVLSLILYLFYNFNETNNKHTHHTNIMFDEHINIESQNGKAVLKYDHSFIASNKYLIESKTSFPTDPIVTKSRIMREWKHDTFDFTQGFEVFDINENGDLIILESTGLYEKSKLKFIQLNSQKNGNDGQNELPIVLKTISLEKSLFGEGCTVFFVDQEDGRNNKSEKSEKYIYQLTWKEKVVLVYDLEFEIVKRLELPSDVKEGWGLYYDNALRQFIATDGSDTIYFIDSKDFSVNNQISVKMVSGKGKKTVNIEKLNELEMVNGWILANVWFDSNIYIISPYNGYVYGIIECGSIIPTKVRFNHNAVLNGIAFDKMNNHLIITGKFWNKIFAIKLPSFMLDKSNL